MIWLTAKEIADAAAAGLMPGLPTTKRNVNKLAERGNWAQTTLARPRLGRDGGGGLEYHIDLLPKAAKVTWMRAELGERGVRIVDTGLGNGSAMDARIALLKMAKRFQEVTGERQTQADVMFCKLFEEGAMELPEWAAAHVRGLSPRSLARWRKDQKLGQIRDVGRPKGTGVLERAENGAVKDLIIGAILKHTMATAKQLRALVCKRYPEGIDLVDGNTGECARIPVPSLRSFERSIKGWKREYRNEIIKITNPDKYRSLVRVTATGSQVADRLNQIWQIDASPADLLLLVGDRAERWNIYVAVDVFSRRMVILLSKTPYAEAVKLLIRKCILRWGVPEIIHTDNGSDFTAKATQKLINNLGIEIELSPPYCPETKGIVERHIGMFQKHLRTFSGFVGHSVEDRKAIESRKAFHERLKSDEKAFFGVELTPEEFQARCDDFAYVIHEVSEHGGLNGKTPFEKAASYTGVVRRIDDEAALNVLLATPAKGDGTRTVGRGGIKIDNVVYQSMGPRVGEKVFVRMDPQDAGRIMMFHPETDEFLGEGWNADLMGEHPAKVAQMSKALQKQDEDLRAATFKKASRTIGSMEIADAIYEEAAAKKQTLVPFPQRSEVHSTPALEGAADAAGTASAKPAQRSTVSEAERIAFLKDFKSERSAPKPKRETDRERFERAKRIEEDLKNGHDIYDSDRNWLRHYQQESEYRSWCEVTNHISFPA